MAALVGAVAHAQRPHGAVAVGDQLHLDVARRAHDLLHQHARVAEGLLGLLAGAIERVRELVGVVDAAHPAAAAAGCGLDHQRVADRVGVTLGVLDALDRASAPRGDGHVGLLGQPLALDLVAERAHHVGVGADEHDPEALAELRELGVLGDEAPANPRRVRARLGQRPLELVVVEVAAFAQAMALVGLADEQRVALGIDVKRDDPDRLIALPVELAHSADGAHRGLAAVDDRQSPEGTLGHRAPAPAELCLRSADRRAHGVKAAVDVHDLAGDPSREVGQQEQNRVGHGPGVLAVPADRRLLAPHLRELLEAGDPAGRDGAQRTGRNQVHADPARTEVARQVAGGRLERRLGDAHPVVHGPRDRRVEVHADDARSLLRIQVGERGAQRLQRERARLKRRDRAVGGRLQEATAERVLGRERDRVQEPVDATPAGLQLLRDRGEVLGLVDVELEHVGGLREALGRALGQAPRPAEARQHDLRAGLLGAASDLPRDRVFGDHAGDQQLLVVEHHRASRQTTTLWPPNPNALVSAIAGPPLMSSGLALPGT